MRNYYGCNAQQDHHFKPKMICVGSATQSKVINKTNLPINDYSLISMITAPFFKNQKYVSCINCFNRRCDKGDTESSAVLSTLIEKIEMGLPVTKRLKDEFLCKFSSSFFIPSDKDITEYKNEIIERLHIAKTHDQLSKLERKISPYMTQVSVREYFTTNDNNIAKITPYVYRAHHKLGACYQSVIYNNDKWLRSDNNNVIYRGLATYCT